MPAITFSAALPATAASPGALALTATGWNTVARCTPITQATVCPTQYGAVAPAGITIEIRLAEGMRFANGTRTATVTTDGTRTPPRRWRPAGWPRCRPVPRG